MPRAKYHAWMTPQALERIKKWVDDGLNDRQISDKMGINANTLKMWASRHKEIRTALFRPIDINDVLRGDKRDVSTCGPNYKYSSPQEVYNLIKKWKADRKAQDLPLTVPSLCVALMISRDQLDMYTSGITYVNNQKMELVIDEENGMKRLMRICDLLKQARAEIESSYLDWAVARNSRGAEFALKNHYNYREKTEITAPDGPVVVSWAVNETAKKVKIPTSGS